MTTSLLDSVAAPDTPGQIVWSEMNAAFLRFARQHDDARRRSAFTPASDRTPPGFVLQPWPIFVGRDARARLATTATLLDRLVREIPTRFFGERPAAIAEYYRVDNAAALARGERVFPLDYSDADMLALLLEEPNGIAGAPTRGDYIHAADGLKCLEMNVGGLVGGLPAQAFAPLYARAEPIQRFLRSQGTTLRLQPTLEVLFRHIIDDSRRMAAWNGGDADFHLVVLTREDPWNSHLSARYTEALATVLAEAGGGRSRVTLCDAGALTSTRDGLSANGEPVHAVLDQHTGGADLRLPFRWFKRRRVNLFSPPAAQMLCDKRNIALLSERSRSDDFTAAERETIEHHVPWTRRVERHDTEFRGRRLRIPDDLVTIRDELVLKKGTSLSGAHVFFGAAQFETDWNQLIARALREMDWIVQERVRPLPYLLQAGPEGVDWFNVIFGLFVFGTSYGGGYLRMEQLGAGEGIVNRARGAEIGPLFESDS